MDSFTEGWTPDEMGPTHDKMVPLLETLIKQQL